MSRRSNPSISSTTAWNLVHGKPVSDKALRGFLRGCGVSQQEHGPWLTKRGELYPDRKSALRPRSSGGWLMSEPARAHFTIRARGHRSGLADTDLFRGRDVALARVCAWLTAEESPGLPLVVTGHPGSGKSALLGRVVLCLEADAGRGAALHARDLTEAAAFTALAPLAGLREAHGPGDLLNALSGTEGVPLMIAVDALDEAATDADRRAIVDLLVNLARLPRLRIVVATRVLSGRDSCAPGTLLSSLAVSAAGGDNLVDLDTDIYFDPEGLRAFVAALLTQDLRGGVWAAYRADCRLTARLSAAVADSAGRNHLVAALAATALGLRDRTVDPADPEFDTGEIPSTVGEAITKYLDTLSDPQRAMTRTLLTALAYARGDGIDERRWVEFAVALGYPVTRMDVQYLRQSPGAAYLVHSENAGGDRTTRLFHQALADELLRQPDNPRRDEQDLLAVLLPGPGREWAHADAYQRSHAADHAAVAGRLSTLLNDLDFLLVADLDRLLPLLWAEPTADVAPITAVLRQATDAGSRSPARRSRLFSLSAAHLGFPRLQAALASRTADPFRVGWAHSLGTPHEVIGGHTGEVRVSLGRFAGRTVIVSGDENGAVHVTDAANGRLMAELPGHKGAVEAVTVGQVDGRGVVVTAGQDGEVRLADTLTSSSVLVHVQGSIYALALGRVGDRDLVVVGGDDGLLVHDLASGCEVYRVPAQELPIRAVAIGRIGRRDVIAYDADGSVTLVDGHGSTIGHELCAEVEEGAIAFTRVDGRDLVVTCGGGPTLVQDPLIGEWGREIGRYAMTICVATIRDRVFVLSTDTSGGIHLIDVQTGEATHQLRGHTDAVTSLAVGSVGGRDVVVSGSLDSMVRIHDLGTEAALGTPLTGHRARVDAVAAVLVDGRTVVVSAGDDGVRMFDTDTGQPIDDPLTGVRSQMHLTAGRAVGRDVIVCGGFGGNLQVFDAQTRDEIGDWSDSSWACVTALALGEADGRDILAVGANDGTVVVLDAESGDRLCRIRCSAHQLTTGRVGDRGFVAVVSNDFTCRVFDATTGGQLSDLSHVTGSVRAIATGSLQGRDVIVTGGQDGRVLLIDPLTEALVDELTEHDGEVHSVAATRIDDDLVVVSGSYDATVRVAAVQSGAVFVIDVVDVVNAVAACDDGRIFVATGSSIFSLVPNPRRSA